MINKGSDLHVKVQNSSEIGFSWQANYDIKKLSSPHNIVAVI